MIKRTMSIFLVVSLASLMVASGVMASATKTWPTKKLTIVVPTRPGGTVDRISRGMAPHLSKEFGVPVVIENRPGGNSAPCRAFPPQR